MRMVSVVLIHHTLGTRKNEQGGSPLAKNPSSPDSSPLVLPALTLWPSLEQQGLWSCHVHLRSEGKAQSANV